MNDFSEYVYPNTKYNAPLAFESHADFLRGGNLRYRINAELHGLGLVELEMVLALLGMLHKATDECAAITQP